MYLSSVYLTKNFNTKGSQAALFVGAKRFLKMKIFLVKGGGAH